MRNLAFLVAMSLFFLPAASLDRAHFTELNKKAKDLSQKKDWQGLRSTLLELGRELPSPTPVYLLRMASVEAHLGNREQALRWLRKYAAMGLRYEVNQDEDLKPLLDESGFQAIVHDMKERTKSVQKTEAICSFPLPDLMPEDVTFDKSSGAFIVSSILHHTLYRVTLPKGGAAECSLKELPLNPDAKRWPVLAVSADPKRGILWMTASAMPGFTDFPKEDAGKAALFAIDLKTGKTLRRFDLASGGPAVLGDMSISEDSTVYVTDSIGGGVYRVHGEVASARLEKIAGDFFSPQTPVLASDGKRLFVADYPIGIAVVNLTRANPVGQLNYLPHPDSLAVTGLDGLLLSSGSLIGIQNGTDPERIVCLHLNAAQTEITSGEVVEQSTERLGEPTHAIAVNGWIYVTANVGWNKVDDQGNLKAGEHFTAPLLLRFPAAKSARK